MASVGTLNMATQSFLAFVFGIVVAVLIPFAGWLYGWQGAVVIVVVAILPAYMFGSWLARASTLGRFWLLTLLSVAAPLVAAAWSAQNADVATWWWLLASVATFVSLMAGSRLQQRQSAT
jgi:hypothetical protein